MGFFRRRKVEEIKIEIKELNIPDEIDSLKKNNVDEKLEEFKSFDLEKKKNYIVNCFLKFQKKNYDLLNNYYICKIFSRIALKDRDFNMQMMSIDKQINKIRKEYEELQKKVNHIKYSEKFNEEELLSSYDIVNNLNLFQKGIVVNLDDAKRKYFNFLKIATVNVCLNKTNQELETLYQNLSSLLNEYKNLNEAAEYIYYNSGILITKTINSLLSTINDYGNVEYIKNYDLKYFLKSDVVITLELTEWIDIYNKMKFVIKIINDNESISKLEFLNNFVQFEIRYLILMMFMETNKDNKKISSFNI